MLEAAPSSACKICGGRAVDFDVVDFNKYCSHEDYYSFGFAGIRVDYLRCSVCGCIFTRFFDKWTYSDFSEKVYNSDYVRVDSEYVSVRPQFTANDMARRWGACHNARVLDFGSGSGAFATELRKLGYRYVETYDPFSSPVRPSGKFDIVTCFEVIEHSPFPLEALTEMCSFLDEDGCIIVSQTLQPANILSLRGSWWYLAPRNGHICTFTANTMALLAQKCGLTFHFGDGPYAFSRPSLSNYARLALSTMGRAHYFMPLFAPTVERGSPSDVNAAWNDPELGLKGAFRWTSSETLTWTTVPIPHTPATVTLLIPCIDQLFPKMLDGIKAHLGSSTGTFVYKDGNLVADLLIKHTADTVIVHTHRVLTPRDAKGEQDNRKLGIAVLCDHS